MLRFDTERTPSFAGCYKAVLAALVLIAALACSKAEAGDLPTESSFQDTHLSLERSITAPRVELVVHSQRVQPRPDIDFAQLQSSPAAIDGLVGSSRAPDLTVGRVIAGHAGNDIGGPSTPPTAAKLASGKSANERDSVSFKGSFADPGILDSHTVEWDFGDGTLSRNSLTPSHVYKDDGVYDVTLTVNDSDGAVGTATSLVFAHNVAPTVSLGAAKLVSEGEIKEFVAEIEDPGALDNHTFAWFFEPNKPLDGDRAVAFAYADEGRYTLTVEVDDYDGGVSTASVLVVVENVAPSVDAGADQTADEGETVRFSGSYVDPGPLDTHTIVWDFGDGHQARNTVFPEHVYENDGDFTVSLTVPDNDGAIGADSIVVRVVNKAPIVQIED